MRSTHVSILQKDQPNFVRPVRSCSDIPGEPDRIVHINQETNKAAKGITASELFLIVTEWISLRRRAEAAQATSEGQSNNNNNNNSIDQSPPRKKRSVLILDSSSVHRSEEFKQAMAQAGQEMMLLPPRSPDLDPNDSHFFGVAKNNARENLASKEEYGWEDKYTELVHQLETVAANPHIINYILKLEACIEARGRRFEKEYKRKLQEYVASEKAKKKMIDENKMHE